MGRVLSLEDLESLSNDLDMESVEISKGTVYVLEWGGDIRNEYDYRVATMPKPTRDGQPIIIEPEDQESFEFRDYRGLDTWMICNSVANEKRELWLQGREELVASWPRPDRNKIVAKIQELNGLSEKSKAELSKN